MNRMLGSLKRKREQGSVSSVHSEASGTSKRRWLIYSSVARDSNPEAGSAESHLDTPEANAARNVVCGTS